MRSDCASVPTRGSRLAGMLSIRKLTVPGSACGPPEQEIRDSAAASNSSGALAWWRIADLAKDCWAARPGGARQVGRPAVHGFVGEQRESKGFLGIGWNSQLI